MSQCLASTEMLTKARVAQMDLINLSESDERRWKSMTMKILSSTTVSRYGSLRLQLAKTASSSIVGHWFQRERKPQLKGMSIVSFYFHSY